ncbi:hypothetical protein SAMN03097699_2171 [Flavobacteriaceae bacterium MAR_2010_188]|nr:hypothetical protein SAMN03097699_2171 [Flavobacteriaceae bacterium MAR_2010_188]
MKLGNRFLYSLLFLPTLLTAQKIDNTVSFRDIPHDRYFRFNYENDYFAATDENYTQGYNLELVLPKLKKNPINYLMLKPEADLYKYGISVEHIGYTPNDYVSSDIQFGDRPFASAIMLKSFVIATNSIKKSRLSQSFSLGLIGPAAFGKEMQVSIHKATGNKIPYGWKNQIKNDIVINYRIDYEKLIFNFRDVFEVRPNATLQIGTLFTNASIGGVVSMGWLNQNLLKNKKDFQLYLFSQPLVSVVGYDASLQGGFFNDRSPYTISSKNLERFTAQFNYGLVLKTTTLFLEYSRTAISREFKSGNSAKWGGIKIGLAF